MLASARGVWLGGVAANKARRSPNIRLSWKEKIFLSQSPEFESPAAGCLFRADPAAPGAPKALAQPQVASKEPSRGEECFVRSEEGDLLGSSSASWVPKHFSCLQRGGAMLLRLHKGHEQMRCLPWHLPPEHRRRAVAIPLSSGHPHFPNRGKSRLPGMPLMSDLACWVPPARQPHAASLAKIPGTWRSPSPSVEKHPEMNQIAPLNRPFIEARDPRDNLETDEN